MFVVAITGVVLLVLCVKIFCCKKPPQEAPESEDSTGGDMGKRTSIRARPQSEESEPQPRERSVEFVRVDRQKGSVMDEDEVL